MNLTEILRAVFINIKESKMRVFLTTLGIIVGSLTIVLVFAIGQGAQADVADQYKTLNVGTLVIMPGFGRRMTQTLTPEDVQAIQEGAPSLKEITMMTGGESNASYGDTTQSVSVAGVTPEYKDITNLEMAYGRFFTNDEGTEKVAVLGADVADLFFSDDVSQAVGQKIMLNGRRYEIVGVLKKNGDSSTPGMSTDEEVFVPFQVAQRYVTGRAGGPGRPGGSRMMVMALAKDVDHVASATDEINAVLEKLFKDKSSEFNIIDAGSRLQAAKDSARTMTLMLLSVATIVLIVGGIGIMNVLFVSVRERTKEIGILKAIGARRKDILQMFLLEAVIVSASGGILGIILSMFAMPLLDYFQIRAIPTLFGYLLAFGFSVAIGTFFGYYPASKAAALKPIDALNYE